ncbi:uncharacterized protein [Centroberyx affinis]|uniref:uncharacterized protein isoform X2 n=1 Tax=Centroberyx affinis TaxID=166261 RepID=UPI003A5BE6DD
MRLCCSNQRLTVDFTAVLCRDTGGEMSHRGKTSKRKWSFPDGPDTGKKASVTDLPDGLTEVQWLGVREPQSPSGSSTSTQTDHSKGDNPDFSIEPRPSGTNTPEERTASDSLINQIREKTTALREEKRAKALDSLIGLKCGKSLHLISEEEEMSELSILEEMKALDSLICRSQEWSLTHLLSSKEEDLSELRLTEDQKKSEEERRSVSPSGSSDAQSDRSKNDNPNFSDTDLYDGLTEEQKMSEEERRSVSPSGSCDAQSDRSKGNNPDFSSSADSGMEDDD